MLARQRRSNKPNKEEIGCTDRSEVHTSLRQTQEIVWATTNSIGIAIILPVVLPIADGANLKSGPSAQCAKAAAGTRNHALMLSR